MEITKWELKKIKNNYKMQYEKAKEFNDKKYMKYFKERIININKLLGGNDE